MAENAQRSRPPPNRRRDKVQLSCDPCRNRKLRCDRQLPCGACSRRGIISSCNYATTSSMSHTQQLAASQQSTGLHGRISELENLVMTLMKGQSLPTPPVLVSPGPSSLSSADASDAQRPRNCQDGAVPTDPGTLELRESGPSYIQSVHWEAILTKIKGLKGDLASGSKAPLGSYLLYGPNRHATRDEILAAVPPRPVVDRLMALHFDSYSVTPYLIHATKFLREYEGFWEDPSAATIAWIGLMFSMLYTAVHLQTFTVDSTDECAKLLKAEYLTMKTVFREKAAQCLILARYTTGGPYILETLTTILTGETVLSKDGATDGGLLVSMIFHLAMRMGYHRDPDHFSGISPFEGEMRRRIWATILQLDLILSLELGLPRAAKDTHIDTKEARNLRDCDFEENTTEMPPPRPETEWTPVLPLIARGRLTSALGLICDVNADIHSPSYDELIKIDEMLEEVHNRAIPAVLRWDTMPHPITDSPTLVIQRVSMETTYHKSRILLYRRALICHPILQSQGWRKDSIQICVESALKILSFQEMLHEESQPFGRLCQLRWKVSRIFNQDVLLATSVLCLYIQDAEKFGLPETAEQPTSSNRAEEIRQRLMISYKIWLQMSTASAEAGKVAKALSIVLGNTETSAEDEHTPYDFFADFDAMPFNELGPTFNNQYFTSGLSSPLAYFDNVLESRGT